MLFPQSSLRPHALQQVFQSRRTDPQVRYEQTSASLRDLLQRAAGRRELVTGAYGSRTFRTAFVR